MAVGEVSRGRRLDVSLPPPGIWEELDEVSATYLRLVADRKATGTKLSALRGALERAKDAERHALAQAIKDRKAEPKATEVEKIEKQIEACERRFAAVEEAIDDALAEVHITVDERRGEWCEDALSRLTDAQSQYAEAIEEVVSRAQDVYAAVALLRFARLFPDDEVAYRARGSMLPTLRGMNGDPFSSFDVFQALRDEARITYDPKGWSARDPIGAAVQALHEARRANEEKGLGYMTDSERALFEANPDEFYGGMGARSSRPHTNGNEGGDDGE
jgi:hypothetical protein